MNPKRSIHAGRISRRPLAACLAALFAAASSPLLLAQSAPPSGSGHAPSSVVVTNCDDSGPGSLRDATGLAGDGDTIDMTQLTCSTISLTTGALVIGQTSLTLEGPLGGRLTLDGSANASGSSLIYHLGFGDLIIEDMTLRNGGKYRTDHAALGGCVHTAGNARILRSSILDCTTSSTGSLGALGGAIYTGGNTYLRDSTISGSHAIARGNGYASGGAIYAQGSVETIYSTIADNDVRSYSSTPTFGGGVFTHSSSYIFKSSVVRNHAKRMGGLASVNRGSDVNKISESTIADNSADYIGGVYVLGQTTIYNSTIADNTATHATTSDYSSRGVGLHIGPSSTVTTYSTLIANNASFEDGGFDIVGDSGAQIVGSNNLVTASTVTLPSDTLSGPVSLGALTDNGGPTPTIALLLGSQGVDAGHQDNRFQYDQRGPGFGRWYGGGPDIGAFENQAQQLFTNGFDFGPLTQPLATDFPRSENFDEATSTIPAFPSGWATEHSGAGRGWSTVLSDAFTQPVAAFANDETTVSDSSLETPAFNVVANGQLRFLHSFMLEVHNDTEGYDGMVLEISIAGAPFVDILDAGGSFIGGGYDHTVSDCCENPLANRQAWSGDSGGYHEVAVNLPSAANGRSVRLRWRLGTDHSDRAQGYWLDDIRIDVGASR
ncbi:MAG TPA: choice-of-anchor Q domain-containing protein [Vicinamibacterales bacterium]|nr:choice-of-anchor Q domain-containing protein [Vicinamibacterales bacterium]